MTRLEEWTSRTIASFSAAGKKTESSSYKRVTSFLIESVHTLDANGRLAQIDSYDDKSGITARTFYSYDGGEMHGEASRRKRRDRRGHEIQARWKRKID